MFKKETGKRHVLTFPGNNCKQREVWNEMKWTIIKKKNLVHSHYDQKH